jgi:predicted exporter
MTSSAALTPAQRRWAVLLWVLVVAAALGQILRTSFAADLSAFLPANPDAQQRC